MKQDKKKNPIYVVTNSGKDVEMVKNLLEAIIVKLHLRPVVDFLTMIFNILLDSVRSSAQLDVIQKFLEKIVSVSLVFSK